MAACFHDRGFEILSDDVCVVGEGPTAFAGIPRLRLWREALEASGRTVDGYEMSFEDMDKYNVPIGDDKTRPSQAPLSHLYLLDDAGGSHAPGISPIRGSSAVEALVANTYRGAYVPLMGRTQSHLQACIKLAREAPVFRVSRLWGLDSLAAGEYWLRESLRLRRETLPEGHWLILSSESILGGHMVAARRFDEAAALLLPAERKLVDARGEDAPVVNDVRKRIVTLYKAWGKNDEAAEWEAKLSGS